MDLLVRAKLTKTKQEHKTRRGYQFFHFNDRESKVLFGIDDDESCQPIPLHV